jgi:hypothetical protein
MSVRCLSKPVPRLGQLLEMPMLLQQQRLQLRDFDATTPWYAHPGLAPSIWFLSGAAATSPQSVSSLALSLLTFCTLVHWIQNSVSLNLAVLWDLLVQDSRVTMP